MRAGELLGAEVYASDGAKVGHVFEVVADKQGPTFADQEAPAVSDLDGPRLTVCELLVGPLAGLLRLGYKTREMKGPPGLRFLQHRFTGYRVPWEEIDSISGRRIDLRCAKADLSEV